MPKQFLKTGRDTNYSIDHSLQRFLNDTEKNSLKNDMNFIIMLLEKCSN